MVEHLLVLPKVCKSKRNIREMLFQGSSTTE